MPSDFDDWETVHRNPGWGSKDLIPLMKKTETYQAGDGKSTHGYSGPLKVSHGGAFTNVGKQFLDVASKWDNLPMILMEWLLRRVSTNTE